MSALKEPAFFVPELRYHPKEVDWYLSLFHGAGSARFVGESSTHYTKRPLFEGVAQRVSDFSPDARLIYLMRDPIDRAISHYWHNTRSSRPEFTETRPMLEAIREDESYRAYGDYAMQIAPWLDLFGRAAVLPLVYEELVRDTEGTLAQVFGGSMSLHSRSLNWSRGTPGPKRSNAPVEWGCWTDSAAPGRGRPWRRSSPRGGRIGRGSGLWRKGRPSWRTEEKPS